MARLSIYVDRSVLKAIGLIQVIILRFDAITSFIDEAGDISETNTYAQLDLYVLLNIPRRIY